MPKPSVNEKFLFISSDEEIQFVSEHLPNRKDANHYFLFKYTKSVFKQGNSLEIKPSEWERLASFNVFKKVA